MTRDLPELFDQLRWIRLKIQTIILMGMTLFSLAFASDKNMAEFIKAAKSMSGHYELAKDSHPSCSAGFLKFVGDKVEEGIHLGHHVFIGPFGDEASKQEEGYCAVDHAFSFSSEGVTQTTKISRCPAAHKKDESVATKTLRFKGNDVYYEIKESDLKCHFIKAKGGSDE